jgi:cytoskeletal protein CcmA (bactofilin family)
MEARTLITRSVILLSTIIWCTPVDANKAFRSGNFRVGANVTVAADEVLAKDLIVAGANVKIAGALKKGLNAFGANLDISGDVDGELNAFGANVVLSGKFRDKVNAGAANLVLEGTFEENLEVGAAKITILPTAVIKGNLNYASAILDRQEGSQILGQIAQKHKEIRPQEHEKRRSKGKKVTWVVKIIIGALSLAALIIVGLIINTFFPDHTESTVALISESPWKNIVVGFVFLVAVPVAVIIAFITIIGIPAGIIAGFVYGLILYVSRIYIGVWIGRKIIGFFKKSQITTFFWPFVIGIVTIAVIGLIPFLGWLFKLFCLLISLGALWLALWGTIQSTGTQTR